MREFRQVDLDCIFETCNFRTTPMKHQLKFLAWSFNKNRVANWTGIGCGKSLMSLYSHELWQTGRHLIVCPNSVVDSWIEQIAEHTHLTPVVLRGTREDRRVMLAEPGDKTFIVNYEGLLVLFCEPVKTIQEDGRTKTKQKLNKELIKAANLDGLTSDECHALANEKATQTKVFHALSDLADHVIIMTGTPISTSEEDLWAEYWCLDGGKTLGYSKWPFLTRHFKKKFFGGFEIRTGQREKILERVAPVTLRFSREECLDLPPRAYEVRRADMTAEQRRLYEEIASGCSWELNGVRHEPVPPEQAANKLGQIAGGFVLIGGEAIRLRENPKLDLLAELIQETDEKIIVFHAYVEEGRLLEERLKKMGIGYASLRGEIRNKAAEVERFRSDDNCRVMPAHPKSGGIGLNLQVATVEAFYSNGLSTATVRQQAEGRIYRQGQEKPVLFVDLELTGSLDEKHLHRIETQAGVQQEALDFVRNYR